MHLLYLDDAGSVGNIKEDYLVLGGVAVHESQVAWLTKQLDDLAATIVPGAPDSVEFHASEIFSRRISPWNRMSKDEARGVIMAVLRIVTQAYDSAKIFACAVHKASYPSKDPMEMAFEDLYSRRTSQKDTDLQPTP